MKGTTRNNNGVMQCSFLNLTQSFLEAGGKVLCM
jgi:hypothetical protein